MYEHDLDPRIKSWLRERPMAASSWVLEAVTRHARSHPRRRPRVAGLFGATGGLAARRPAVIALRPLVLLALLAVAFAAGGLAYAAWQRMAVVVPAPSPTATTTESPGPAFGCPPGIDPDQPGPLAQQRPRGAPAPLTFDRQRSLVVGALSGDLGGPAIWTFDVCRNEWRVADVELQAAPAAVVYDSNVGDWLMIGSRLVATADSSQRVWSFDPDSKVVTQLAPTPFLEGDLHAVFRSATGQLIVRDDSDAALWAYDRGRDAWQALGQAGAGPGGGGAANLLAYDSSVDRLVFYWSKLIDARTFEYDFGQAAWQRYADPPHVDLVWGDLGRYEIVFDEANARTLVVGMHQVIGYDAAAHSWERVYIDTDDDLETGPHAGGALAYDATNRRVVMVHYRSSAPGIELDPRVAAFDLASRTWLEPLVPLLPEPSPPTAEPFACPPGSDPTTAGPADQERPSMRGSAVFDSRRGRATMMTDDTGDIWWFDVCANRWHRGPAGQTYGRGPMVYDPASDLTLRFAGSATEAGPRVIAYDADADTLSDIGPSLLSGGSYFYPSIVLRQPDGRILGLGNELSQPRGAGGVGWLAEFDVARRSWTLISAVAGDIPEGYGGEMWAYDESANTVVLCGIDNVRGMAAFALDVATATWRRAADPPQLSFLWGDLTAGHEIAYDAGHQRTVIFSDGLLAAYDAAADAWTTIVDDGTGRYRPTSLMDVTLTYDPVNERTLVLAGARRTRAGWVQADVVAFDLGAETWLQLTLSPAPSATAPPP